MISPPCPKEKLSIYSAKKVDSERKNILPFTRSCRKNRDFKIPRRDGNENVAYKVNLRSFYPSSGWEINLVVACLRPALTRN